MAMCRRNITNLLSSVVFRKSPKFRHSEAQILAVQTQREDGRRHLFSSEILGLESYARQKSFLVEKSGMMRERFFKRMDDYMKASENNTIFTDDVKTMVYFTETNAELDTGVKMLKRFHLQNNDLRFSNFVFGPLVMRLLYTLRKPDVAFELFTDKSLTGMFDQMSSFVVLMDLLYESKQYERVLTVMDVIKGRQLNGFKYPIDCLTLAIASCYQMNTAKSLETLMTMLKESQETGSTVSLRSATYAAMLAYKQGKPDVALEMLSVVALKPSSNVPVAYVNIKLHVICALNRAEDAVDQLKMIVQQDVPDHITRGGELFEEVLAEVRKAVDKNGSKELKHQLDVTEKALRGGNHLAAGQNLEAFLQRPILRQRKLQDGFKQRERSSIDGFRRMSGKQSYRPGLLD